MGLLHQHAGISLLHDFERDVADTDFATDALGSVHSRHQKIGAARGPWQIRPEVTASIVPALAKEHRDLSIGFSAAGAGVEAHLKSDV